MTKITSLTGVFYVDVNYEGEEAEVSVARTAVLAKILQQASTLDLDLRELVLAFVDFVKRMEGQGAES